MRQRRPGIEVYVGTSQGRINITDYLSDKYPVTTTKHINQAAGMATVPVVLKKHGGKVLYGLISPMSSIEIKMGEAGDLKTVFIGFVVNVSRGESLRGGKPSREVTISAEDYGKAFKNMQIFYLRQYIAGKSLLTNFKFVEQYGNGKFLMSAAEFMETMLEIVNDYIIGLWGGQDVQTINSAISVSDGMINPANGLQSYEGPIWNLMKKESDAPWNELYIDTVDGFPYLVYRHAPFKHYGGGYIQGSAESLNVSLEDVESIRVSRSDQDVANFFWVDVSSFSYVSDQNYLADAVVKEDPTVFVDGYHNNDPNIYGQRLMRVTSRHAPTGMVNQGFNVPEAVDKENSISFFEWAKYRRDMLGKMNKDNSVFESGTISIKGNVKARVGMYLNVKGKGEYYINRVSHSFMPFKKFSTRVNVIRGTGKGSADALPKGIY